LDLQVVTTGDDAGMIKVNLFNNLVTAKFTDKKLYKYLIFHKDMGS
jgi:hypothetical protein